VNHRERYLITAVLLVISLLTTVDLVTDTKEGVALWHILIEGFVAIFALISVFFLLKGAFRLKRSLDKERQLSSKLQIEAENWKGSSKKYLDGLSQSINHQLTIWGLTASEREVAFLLLKGFSTKEISEIRNTAEKTARAQATSIYAKAGLSGRSQLSAFFLEDLLAPSS
jgi:DNA-binding CsgD family transcriptional regulator